MFVLCFFLHRAKEKEKKRRVELPLGRWMDSSFGAKRREGEREIERKVASLCRLIQSWCSVAVEIRWLGFCRLLQHGIQLVGQVVEHAADVIEDAHRCLLLSHRAGCKHRQKITASHIYKLMNIVVLFGTMKTWFYNNACSLAKKQMAFRGFVRCS